jgi:hypothetical protein
LECQVINSIDVETHTVFIGKVINAEVLSNEEPLTYAHYQQIKRELAPSPAPINNTWDKPWKREKRKIIKCKNMSAQYADMCMTLQLEIQIQVLLQVRPLKTFRKIGYAPFAVLARSNFNQYKSKTVLIDTVGTVC